MNQFRVGCNNTSPLQIGIPSICLCCKGKAPIEGKKCSKCVQWSDLHSKIEPIGSSYKRTLKTSKPTELAIKLGRLTVQNGSTDSQVSQFLASSATCWHSWCFLRESWRKDPQGMVSAATGAFPPYSLTGAGYSQEARLWDWLLQFVTESKLALLSALQANESKRWAVETRNMTVFRKQADKVDNWIMSQHYHLTGLWVGARFFYRTRRRSDEELIPNQGLTSRALYS